MTLFDPNAFLDSQVTEVNEKRANLPVENPDTPDGLYTAVIGEIGVKTGDKDGKPWISMTVPLRIEVPASLQESLKLPPQLTLTDRAFLDVTESGSIDNSPGKNRGQKAYREATDLNKPGDAFSWRALTGKVVKVKIAHEMYQDAIQEKVGRVLKA